MLKAYCWVMAKLHEERGSNGAEYALLIALIAIAIVITVGAVGTNLSAFFGKVGDKIAVWATSPGLL